MQFNRSKVTGVMIMKKITAFLFISISATVFIAQAQLTNERPMTVSGSTQLNSVLNRANLVAIQKYIFKQGNTQTYCNMFNNNPFYKVDNYFFLLEPRLRTIKH